MNLDDVHQNRGNRQRRRRIGRGAGSGHGKTCGRGHNGQGSRNGFSMHPTFEGGQMPLSRRVPKRGFNNRWARIVLTLNLSDLEKRFAAGDEVTPETLKKSKLVKGRYDVLKILGDGELTKKLTIAAHRFSRTALEKIDKAGGKAIVLERPKAAPKKNKATS